MFEKYQVAMIKIIAAVIGLLLFCLVGTVPALQEREIFEVPVSLFITQLGLLAAFSVILFLSPKKYQKTGSLICFWLSPVFAFFLADSLNQVNIFKFDLGTTAVNLSCFLVIQLLFYLISGRLKFSAIASASVALIFGITNHYVSLFRGSPLLPWDFLGLKTAVSVMTGYEYTVTVPLLLSLLLFVLFLFIAWRISDEKKAGKRKLSGVLLKKGGVLAVCAVTVYGLLFTSIPSAMGIFEFPWNQKNAYRANGSFANFILNTKYLMVECPDNYSMDKIDDIIQKVSDKAAFSHSSAKLESDNLGSEGKTELDTPPNIIVIMNESFSDLRAVGDFETDQEVMPFIEKLTENTIKGYTQVSVHGGTTCNTEFEMLTSSTTGFLPVGSVAYQQYIREETGSLATSLKEAGYANAALHPYYATGWNRDTVYPLLGFDRFLIQNNWIAPEKLRGYISDQSNHEKLIELTEEKQAEKLFLFNVTMQNHSGYTSEDYETTVHLQGMEGNYPKTEQYLSLIRQTDEAFQNLIEYYQSVEEPTLILMFGDHQPAIEESFYEELYGKPLSELSLEEMQKRYMTPFILWANYDIEEREIPLLSANYLSTLLLDTAGFELPVYHQFLKQLSEVIPAINAYGFMDAEGNWYGFDEETPYDQQINEYQILQYNNLFDRENRVDEIFKMK